MKKREWSKSNLAVFIILGIILFIIILTIWKINDVFRPRKTEQIKIDPADLIPESEDYYCIQDVKEQEDDGVMTILGESFSMYPKALGIIYPTQSIILVLKLAELFIFTSTASSGINFGSVVMIVRPAADCGSSSTARSL